MRDRAHCAGFLVRMNFDYAKPTSQPDPLIRPVLIPERLSWSAPRSRGRDEQRKTGGIPIAADALWRDACLFKPKSAGRNKEITRRRPCSSRPRKRGALHEAVK